MFSQKTFGEVFQVPKIPDELNPAYNVPASRQQGAPQITPSVATQSDTIFGLNKWLVYFGGGLTIAGLVYWLYLRPTPQGE
jgi:hypothetical protein